MTVARMLRWTAVLLLCAVFLPLRAADRLDRLEADLDRLEPRFWRAAGMSPDEPYYQETAELLARLESNGRDVQQILSRARLDQMPNLSEPVSRLRNLFPFGEPSPGLLLLFPAQGNRHARVREELPARPEPKNRKRSAGGGAAADTDDGRSGGVFPMAL
ncbi:MAG: hypothetical protein L6W00_27570 [Lentisphaeria bacterium]|nr:MAG: hypothetical protein L6W00_27570 [Lentisphaeria bacterium]